MFASAIRPVFRAARPTVLRAGRPLGVKFNPVRFASTNHEWVTFDSDSNVGIVGITDYAQKALGDVVFIDLPAVGAEIAQGDEIGAVESVKAASEIYAPVAGTIEEINESLGDNPSLLNKKPESDGWLAKIKLSNPTEFDTLLNAEAYKAHCEGQSKDE